MRRGHNVVVPPLADSPPRMPPSQRRHTEGNFSRDGSHDPAVCIWGDDSRRSADGAGESIVGTRIHRYCRTFCAKDRALYTMFR